MAFNVYKGSELIAEKINGKEYTAEGLTPNTEYSFSVSEVIGDKESEKATITVKTKQSDVASVAVAPKTNSVDVGKTKQLNATVLPATAPQTVTWKSDKENIATVNASGLVTAVAQGSAIITSTAGNKADTATVTVTVPVVTVAGVTLSPKTSTSEAGKADGANLTATVAPPNATNRAVTYSIAPTTTGLTVISSGRVEWTDAVPAGTYTTTVKTTDGAKTDTHVLTLTAAPEPEPEE